MLARSFLALLVLAGASLAFVGNASAATGRANTWQPDNSYMSDRHNPADTNGF